MTDQPTPETPPDALARLEDAARRAELAARQTRLDTSRITYQARAAAIRDAIREITPELAARDAALAACTAQLVHDQAALARVRSAVRVADDEDVTDWQRGYRACSERSLAALEPPAHDGGPTVAEAKADDRRWPLQKGGE